MITCGHLETKKFGKDRKGNQRYRCLSCGKTWIEQAPKPLGDMRIDRTKAVLALRMLLEGNSIRSVERITGLHRDTLLKLVVLIGQRCRWFLRTKVRGLEVCDVEVDETWGFVFCKQKTANKKGYGPEVGDCYTFVAFERHTKMVLTWYVGKRDGASTDTAIRLLARATHGTFQLTTDGFQEYKNATYDRLPQGVDYATLIKIYGTNRTRGVEPKADSRYSPAEIIDIESRVVRGNPVEEMICTSHVERNNLNIRMGVRRMTRLTNGHSKKWENHEAAMAMYFAYYNFCRVHTTTGKTPAVASGLADSTWSVDRLLDEVATQFPATQS